MEHRKPLAPKWNKNCALCEFYHFTLPLEFPILPVTEQVQGYKSLKVYWGVDRLLSRPHGPFPGKDAFEGILRGDTMFLYGEKYVAGYFNDGLKWVLFEKKLNFKASTSHTD